MSLVPQDNRPRVLPKVFADVPSAAELSSARGEIAAARSGRNRMGLLVILLVGMLIAAGAGLVYFETQARELPDQISALEDEKAELQKTIAEGEEALEQLRVANDEAIEEYTVIDKRMKRNDEVREAIRVTLEEKPGAAKTSKPPLGSEDSHTAYEKSAWLEIRHDAEERLAAETEALEKIEEAVKSWKPPRRNPGVDPRD